MNLTFGLGASSSSTEPVIEYVYTNLLEVNVDDSAVVASVASGDVAVDVSEASAAVNVVSEELIGLELSGGDVSADLEG